MKARYRKRKNHCAQSMIAEVFKTNVVDRDKADFLIHQIQHNFENYRASFDLDDCDRILVVRSVTDRVQPAKVIDLLKFFECNAEVLPDE
jgi:hypothetical protein